MSDDERAPFGNILRLSHKIRLGFQVFLAGVGAIYIMLFILGALKNGVYTIPPTVELDHAQLFGFIGGLLGVSAAVELAFMLLTEGPDEAVDPLLLSISAAAL